MFSHFKKKKRFDINILNPGKRCDLIGFLNHSLAMILAFESNLLIEKIQGKNVLCFSGIFYSHI